jgi:hypothetical protein
LVQVSLAVLVLARLQDDDEAVLLAQLSCQRWQN